MCRVDLDHSGRPWNEKTNQQKERALELEKEKEKARIAVGKSPKNKNQNKNKKQPQPQPRKQRPQAINGTLLSTLDTNTRNLVELHKRTKLCGFFQAVKGPAAPRSQAALWLCHS